MRKPVRIFALMLILCLMLSGCSGDVSDKSTDTDSGYNSEEYQEEDGGASMSVQSAKGAEDVGDVSDEDYQEDVSSEGNSQNLNQEEKDIKAEKTEEKLVYTCDIDIETTTYQETVTQIKKIIKDYKGIIESQEDYENETGWDVGDYKTSVTMITNITVKVPAKDYEAFLKSLDGKGKTTRKNMNVTNISRSYYDTSATVEALKIQEKRLLEMMEQAKTIDDMIAVEKRLTEVQTQLNQEKTRLSMMDTEVAYSTITLNIEEVLEYKNQPEGRKTNKFVDRLIYAFKDSWNNFLSFLEKLLFLCIRLLPFAICAAIILIITTPLRRKHKEKTIQKKEIRQKKKQAAREKKEESKDGSAKEEKNAANKKDGQDEAQ